MNEPVGLDRINAVFDVYEMQPRDVFYDTTANLKFEVKCYSLLSGMTSPNRITTSH